MMLNLDKPEMIQRVYLSLSSLEGKGEPRVLHTFEARVNGEWKLLRKGYVSGMMPAIEQMTKQVRLTFEVPKGGVRVDEVHLIAPARESSKALLSW